MQNSGEVHFAGGPPSFFPWQNYCVVVEVPEESVPEIYYFLGKMAKRYRQDSIAIQVGRTEFIRPHVTIKEEYGNGQHIR